MSALLSAQFVGWLLPGAAIAWNRGARRPAACAFAAAALTGLIWGLYDFVLARAPAALALIVFRNLILAVMTASAIAAVARTPRTIIRDRVRPGVRG